MERNNGSETDNNSSCSSDPLDFSKVSMGSIVGDSMGSVEKSALHKMFEDKEVSGEVGKEDERGVALEGLYVEKGRLTLNVEPANINVDDHVYRENRALTLMDKSMELVVDLCLGPLHNLNLGPVLTMMEHSGESGILSVAGRTTVRLG